MEYCNQVNIEIVCESKRRDLFDQDMNILRETCDPECEVYYCVEDIDKGKRVSLRYILPGEGKTTKVQFVNGKVVSYKKTL